ncbi:putative glutamate receptor [Oratosquilla oratoria]|uniref:putative glutamate receptor n=1 Tax=Oratosquilla oratoria TaxID=337810 RepID=UPI003F76B5EB
MTEVRRLLGLAIALLVVWWAEATSPPRNLMATTTMTTTKTSVACEELRPLGVKNNTEEEEEDEEKEEEEEEKGTISVKSRVKRAAEDGKSPRGQSPMNFKFDRAPHLVIAAEEWPPHVYVTPSGDGTAAISGPMAQLLESLAVSINFTYTVVQGDGYWGAPQENGDWNGMIGMVLRKEADIGLGPFGMSPTRSQVVDFTSPVFLEKYRVLVQRPRPVPNPLGFLSPLSWYVWVGLLLSAILVIVTTLSAARTLDLQEPSTVLHHVWAAFGIFFSQPVTSVVRGNAHRFAALVWISVTLIVMRSYSGALTSLLAVKTVAITHDSLQDVIDDQNIQFIFEGSTALTAYMQEVQSGIYKDLAETSKGRSVFFQASGMTGAAYELIPDGSHAMLVEEVVCKKVYSDHFSLTGRCEFYMSSNSFWPLIFAMTVQKGSSLLQPINARIQALNEFGIYDRWANAEMPNMTACIKTPTKLTIHESYALKDLWVVFLLLVGGNILASVFFVTELLVHWGYPQLFPPQSQY